MATGRTSFVVTALIFAASLGMARPAFSQAASGAAVSPASANQAEFFEAHVRPVLINNCYTCHGPKTQMAGLRLDSLSALLKGTAAGHVVLTPGDPDHSALIQAVGYAGDVKMPPSGKLPAADIAALTAWVKSGTVWPGSAAHAEIKAIAPHWAFVPVHKPAVPVVRNRAWVKSPIDAFVESRLEHRGLAPAPPADRRTLIRRATYDLIGLPPTQDEIDDFVRDRSPDAFAHVVDRLLASPHYGERWGRYWLDIARYADTKGYVFVEDRSYPFAYTYRDWVIRSLNEDLPYDQFLIQQLAADQLTPLKDRRSLAALGFLTIGRRFLNNPPDIIDDRIDVVCRGMMGLTVSCARCHNHKFDPIPTSDYYSLYGVFASTDEPKELPIIDTRARQEAYDLYTRELKSRQDALAAYKSAHKVSLAAMKDGADPQIAALQHRIDTWSATPPPAPDRAMVVEDLPNPVKPHVFLRGNPNNPGETVPRHFLSLLTGGHPAPFEHGSGRLELAKDIASKDNPLTARVMVNRIWMHQFGEGLVRTPSDFGMRADPPTYPKLLDYLAARFVEDGWSIKKMIRFIMLSNTYQESSDDIPANRKVDPENRLLWRMNRQRLDFEAMRDSVLAVSGTIDLHVGGPSVDIASDNPSPRRSVYAYIDRQNLPTIFRTFDLATPDSTSPQRHVTSVPQQALFMMNSPFIIDNARRLAAMTASSNSAAGVQKIYHQVFGRAATPREVSLATAFLHAGNLAHDPGPESASPAWQYGYGEVDPAIGRTRSFHILHWSGTRWQGGEAFPDPRLGFVVLTGTGGHPGNDLQHAAIRRWTAPRDGVISITGTITHRQPEGDGVHAQIVSSRSGIVGSWTAHNSAAETTAAGVVVKKGDTIDFVTDCRADPGFDSFTWQPVIRMKPGTGPARLASLNSSINEWSGLEDFRGPVAAELKPLTPWEQYAQVLLMTNEFDFID